MLPPSATAAGPASGPRTGLPVALACGLGLACLATRLAFLPRWVEDHDSVNFALGLAHFDLAAHRPHFPGYPVYLAAAWPAYALGVPAPVALALPGIVAGATAAAGLALATARHTTAWAGVLAGAVYAALPGVALADVTPLSDALGLHLGTMALAGLLIGRRSGRFVAAGLAGALVGARLSYLPWAAGLLAAALWRANGRETQAAEAHDEPHTALQDRRVLILIAVLAVAAWGLPLLACAGGPAALWDVGATFAHGHLVQWGGSAWAPDPSASRVTLLGWNVGGWLLGAWGVALLAVILVAVGASRFAVGASRVAAGTEPAALSTSPIAWAVGVTVPYALWAAVGQNPEHARHVLPLAPVFALTVAFGALAVWRHAGDRTRPLLALALVVCAEGLAFDTAQRLATRTTIPSAAVRIAQWYARQPPEQSHLLTGSEAGVVRLLAPAHRSGRVLDAADADRVLARAPARREWATSSIAGITGRPHQWECRMTFAGRPGVDRPGAGIDVCARIHSAEPRRTIAAAEVSP
ncbi:MAG: hypothetical protein EXR79_08000 [Myxococcales bacterium]|nr:hypothetical protein [Myxococcales bacterium]